MKTLTQMQEEYASRLAYEAGLGASEYQAFMDDPGVALVARIVRETREAVLEEVERGVPLLINVPTTCKREVCESCAEMRGRNYVRKDVLTHITSLKSEMV